LDLKSGEDWLALALPRRGDAEGLSPASSMEDGGGMGMNLPIREYSPMLEPSEPVEKAERCSTAADD
jgi:hypothetical protein